MPFVIDDDKEISKKLWNSLLLLILKGIEISFVIDDNTKKFLKNLSLLMMLQKEISKNLSLLRIILKKIRY